MSIRVDPADLTPTPPLDPSELDRGMMNMRAVVLAALTLVVAIAIVAAAIGATLWFAFL